MSSTRPVITSSTPTPCTDVWARKHHEGEIEERNAVFSPYQVNEKLMAKAEPFTLFMHCLPAHRGWDVTPGVLDGTQSIEFDQAENRLHVQEAVLVLLVDRKTWAPAARCHRRQKQEAAAKRRTASG